MPSSRKTVSRHLTFILLLLPLATPHHSPLPTSALLFQPFGQLIVSHSSRRTRIQSALYCSSSISFPYVFSQVGLSILKHFKFLSTVGPSSLLSSAYRVPQSPSASAHMSASLRYKLTHCSLRDDFLNTAEKSGSFIMLITFVDNYLCDQISSPITSSFHFVRLPSFGGYLR